MSRSSRYFLYVTILFNFLLFLSYFSYLINPEKIIVISLLGLTYPLLVILNIFFFFFWLFKKNLFFLSSLLVLMAGYYHHSRFIQLSLLPYKAMENEDHFKIMSYNVRLFDLYNWTDNKKARDHIIDQIKEEKPDIICFQEYYYSRKNDFKTRELIIKDLDMPYYYESFTDSSNKNTSFFGLATFSKYPIINNKDINFKNDNANKCIWSDILIKKDTFRVYNSHVGSIRFNYSDYNVLGGKGSPLWPHQKRPEQQILKRLKLGFKKRAVQLKQLLPIILKSPYNVVICSDLNDTPISYAYHCFDRYFTDAFTTSGNGIGGSYIGNIPGLRIDYIWHSKKLNSSAFTTHHEKLSDHKAISAVIHYPK